MSLGLTKPGASAALRHPKTGALLKPIGYLKNGTAVWPVLGASSDDEDDPAFVGGGDGGSRRNLDEDETEDDTDDDEDEEEDSSKSKKKTDDEDDERKPTRPERQAAKYRTERNELRRELEEIKRQRREEADKDKPVDELMKRDLTEARERVEKLSGVNQVLAAQLAFFKSNTIAWIDPNDAFALADRAGLFDDVTDEDGNVDTRELQRGLRELAKKKPHLVQKSRAQDEDSDEDEDPRSGSTMNGNRRGKKKVGSTRSDLAKRFPVLGN